MRNIVGHSQPLFFMFDKDPQQPSSLLIRYQLNLDSPLSEPLDLMEGFPDHSISIPPLVLHRSIDNDILGNTRAALPYLLPTAQLQMSSLSSSSSSSSSSSASIPVVQISGSVSYLLFIPSVGQIVAVFTDTSSGDMFWLARVDRLTAKFAYVT
ncbi:hypothetical protein QOT17_014848 [Balamuthia mandrillaris]